MEFINTPHSELRYVLNGGLYVDKTMMLDWLNSCINTDGRFICVTRPRRFGKTLAVSMIAEYYRRGYDARDLFTGLAISSCGSFEVHRNRYNVIHVNMLDCLYDHHDPAEMMQALSCGIINELRKMNPDMTLADGSLRIVLQDYYDKTGISFIFLIDEWDSVFRVKGYDSDAQKVYLDYLRDLFKGRSYIALAYMTGILPIKKYGEHSALNMFKEISMTNASPLQEFTGFTEKEVRVLCRKHKVNFSKVKAWYNGYNVNGMAIYNPKSVTECIKSNWFDDYWSQTESTEALKVYIENNIFGIYDAILQLLEGESLPVNTRTFSNDMVTFGSLDHILTLLIHLGYLTYNYKDKTVRIPNYEIRQEFAATVDDMGWKNVASALSNSEDLLKATYECNGEAVAKYIDEAHRENASILQYNDENSLSTVITLAYYVARKDYKLVREMPAGNGFADIAFVPLKGTVPAMLVELKYDDSADTAIKQIKEKHYPDCFKEYSGQILLVGINYDTRTKCHSCIIEKTSK
ncbi:MAG: ATP-binding protein [Clostridia bacterium]|nr:ATP-binding protein [Clostridia bacterium]